MIDDRIKELVRSQLDDPTSVYVKVDETWETFSYEGLIPSKGDYLNHRGIEYRVTKVVLFTNSPKYVHVTVKETKP